MKLLKLILVRLREDRGASLIIVLAVSIFMSVIVAAMVYASTGNLMFAKQLGTPDSASTDVDNAMQTAINQIRNTTYNDNATANCPPLTMVGANTDDGLAVTCESTPGTGTFGKVPSTSANKPPAAIMTLGSTESQGIDLAAGSALTAFGEATSPIAKVASNSPIRVRAGASLNVGGGGTIQAPNGDCTSVDPPTDVPLYVPYDPALPCGSGTVADPAYTQPAAADYSAIYKTVCDASNVNCVGAEPTSCASGTVTFTPGYYDNAEALSALMNTTCPTNTFWFQGAVNGATYYFDFHNGETPVSDGTFSNTTPATAGCASAACWTITTSTVRVVAGGTVDPGASPTIPGSCLSPVADSANNGARLVFGGRSQLVLTAGQVEICGEYETGAVPTSIYGARTGANPAETQTNGQVLSGTPTIPAPCVSTRQFGTAGALTDAQYADDIFVSTGLLNNSNPRACIELTGFAPNFTIPKGSILTNATLLVRHQVSNDPGTLQATITPTVGTGVAPIVNLLPIGVGSTQNSMVDVTDQLFPYVHSGGFTGATILYDVVRGAQNITDDLDSVQLSLTIQPPSLRAQDTLISGYTSNGSRPAFQITTQTSASTTANLTYPATGAPVSARNCVGTNDYPANPSSCAFINAGAGSIFYSQGTVYAPKAALDITQSGFTQPLFPYGLIGRKLAFNFTSPSTSNNFNGASVVLPPDTPGSLPVSLEFKAYTCASAWAAMVCPDTGQGPDTSTSQGSSRVSYTDATTTPVSGARTVTVQSYDIAPQQLPTVADVRTDSVTAITATLRAKVSANGYPITAPIPAEAVQCRYSIDSTMATGVTTVNATVIGGLPTSADASGVDVFCGSTGLSPQTQYYYTVSATNSQGTTTSEVLPFTTAPVLPWVTAGAATAVAPLTATLSGTVTANGFQITAVQCKYSTDPAMTTGVTTVGAVVTGGLPTSPTASGVAVSCDLTGLSQGTAYFYTLEATNSQGTRITAVGTFTTSTLAAPTVFSSAATSVTSSTATLPGTVTANGGAITAVTCKYSTDPTMVTGVTTVGATVTGGLPTSITAESLDASCDITGLSLNVQYFFTLAATNSQGTTTSAPILNFRTSLPIVTSSIATSVTSTSATLPGTVSANGVAITSVQCRYATSKAGVPSATPVAATVAGGLPTSAGATGLAAACDITGLAGNTRYYFTLEATNGVGTTVSVPVLNFWTTREPIVTSSAATSITSTTATLNGLVTANSRAITGVWCRYATSAGGVPGATPFAATPFTTTNSAVDVPVSCAITGLSAAVQYFFTVEATNSDGTTTSTPILSFTTATPPTISGASISGTVAVGSVLTAVPGTVTGLPTPTPTYQWKRASTVGGTYRDIAGATGLTYTPVVADGTRFLTVTITETNAGGSASATSAATIAVPVAAPTEGTPTITGTLGIGSTLTANAVSVTGTPTPTPTYQWRTAVSSGGTYIDIVGATGSTYTPVLGDGTRFLKVVVTETNGVGSPVSATSLPTLTVPVLVSGQAAPTITGTLGIGSTLTANVNSPTGTPAPTPTYQWQSANTAGGTYVDIAGATGSTYIPVLDDGTTRLKVAITQTNGVSAPVRTLSAATLAVPATAPTIASASIGGTVAVGSVLTASTGTVTGTPTPTPTYQWQSAATSGGTYTNISGATGSTYTPVLADATRFLKVAITETNPVGSPAVATSVATVTVFDPSNAAPTIASATITGTVRLGSPLTANANTVTGTPTPTPTYQWQGNSTICGGAYSNIAGAIGATYTPVAGDVGKCLKVVITETNGVGSPAVATSAATVAVITSGNTAPVIGSATITGTVAVGSVLTANGVGVGGVPVPTPTYQWQSAATAGGTYTSIVGATASTYTPVSGDFGLFLEVVITETNGIGSPASATSAATVVVAGSAPTEGTPTITGTLGIGSTLTANAVNVTGTPTPTPTYQWRSAVASAGTYVNIVGATGSTYTPVLGDGTRFLKVVVTETNGVGSPVSATSLPTLTVPVLVSGQAAPTITGTLGIGSTLTANVNSPTGTPAPTPTYQWQSANTAGGTYTNIVGATASTYIPVLDDATTFLKVAITQTNGVSAPVRTLSAATIAVPATAATIASASITGAATVGTMLTANANTVAGTPTPTPTYRWQSANTAGGTYIDISGATASTYTLVSSDADMYVRAVITESNGFGTPATATSAGSGPVV